MSWQCNLTEKGRRLVPRPTTIPGWCPLKGGEQVVRLCRRSNVDGGSGGDGGAEEANVDGK